MSNNCLHPGEVTGVCTGGVINWFAKFSLIVTRANVRIVVSPTCTPKLGFDVGVLTEFSTVFILDSGVDMLANVEIVVVTIAAIAFEFVVKVVHAMEVWARATGAAVGVNGCRSASVIPALEIVLSAP